MVSTDRARDDLTGKQNSFDPKCRMMGSYRRLTGVPPQTLSIHLGGKYLYAVLDCGSGSVVNFF